MNKVIHWNPKDFAVSQNFNKVIRENEKVPNDYYWKSNKSESVDCFGRALDLITLINKPDGYLQGRLAETGWFPCYISVRSTNYPARKIFHKNLFF